MGFVIARIIAVILLFLAIEKHPYDYYILIRFVVCGVTAYGAYFTAKIGKENWAWIFGITAILFNPIIPIHLNRETWAFIDIIVAILLLVSIFLLKKQK